MNSDIHLLLSPYGQQALRSAEELSPRESDYLASFQILSRQYPPDLARCALEIAILRTEAIVKFPFAEQLYFTRPALEQASSWAVSTYRAARFSGFQRVIDLGCSIGADTMAFAKTAEVIGIDRDSQRLAYAQANLKAVSLNERVHLVTADLTSSLPFSGGSRSSAIFFDPARRHDGRRLYSVHDYRPPLSTVNKWLPDHPAIGVKLSPGVDRAELEGFQGEIEFISLAGSLKEAVLWFGPLQSAHWRATVLPGPHTLVAEPGASCPFYEPLAYVYEPDPAVLRAMLVQTLAIQLDAGMLDPDIAYLTAHGRVDTPFARVWAVDDWLPFNLKRLRAYLRERHIGRITVKKRGSPLEPDQLIRDLKLRGDKERVIFLTHLMGKPIVIVALPNQGAAGVQTLV